jgi:hypothetical protein
LASHNRGRKRLFDNVLLKKNFLRADGAYLRQTNKNKLRGISRLAAQLQVKLRPPECRRPQLHLCDRLTMSARPPQDGAGRGVVGQGKGKRLRDSGAVFI